MQSYINLCLRILSSIWCCVKSENISIRETFREHANNIVEHCLFSCGAHSTGGVVINLRTPILYVYTIYLGFSVQWPEIVELQTARIYQAIYLPTQKEEDCGSKAQSSYIEDSFGSSPMQRERATVGVYKASLRRNEIAPDGMCIYLCVVHIHIHV